MIPRRYDGDGRPDEGAPYGVTMRALEPSSVADDILDLVFRVWRTDGDFCGFADTQTPLRLSIEDGAVEVSAGEIRVTGGEGVGRKIADEQELVEENMGLVEQFLRSLTEQLALTINYEDFSTAGGELALEAEHVYIDEQVHLQLDFDIVEGG